MSETADFFRSRPGQMIDLRHPLAVLASRMPWQEIEASIAHQFAKQVREGKTLAEVDLFGSTVLVSGAGVAAAHDRQKGPAGVFTSASHRAIDDCIACFDIC